MQLVQLIYASEGNGRLKLETVADILKRASRNNAKLGVTGFLAFGQHRFMQLLEGGADAVNETFQRICRDRRHRAVKLLNYQPVSRREFPEWSMGDCDLEGLTNSPLFRHCATHEFRPDELDGAAALSLLKELDQLRRDRGERHAI